MNHKRQPGQSISNIEEEDLINNFIPSQKTLKNNEGISSSPPSIRPRVASSDVQITGILEARKFLHDFLDKIGVKKYQAPSKNELKEILKISYEPIQSYENFINLYENDIQKMVTNRQIKKNWNRDDILLLIWIVQKYCSLFKVDLKSISQHNWDEISKIMPGKSTTDCKYKWLSMKKCNVSLSPWTSQEDVILQEIVQDKGSQWVEVSKILYSRMEMINKESTVFRTSKQCREHYNNFLDPNLKRIKWNDEEDRKLIYLQRKYGNKWSLISKEIPGRTDNSVKNRFMTIKNRQQNKGDISLLGNIPAPIVEVNENGETPQNSAQKDNIKNNNNPFEPYDMNIKLENVNNSSNGDVEEDEDEDLDDNQYDLKQEEKDDLIMQQDDSNSLENKRKIQKKKITDLDITNSNLFLNQNNNENNNMENVFMMCDTSPFKSKIRSTFAPPINHHHNNNNNNNTNNGLFQYQENNIFNASEMPYHQQKDNNNMNIEIQNNNHNNNNFQDLSDNYLIKKFSTMEISPTLTTGDKQNFGINQQQQQQQLVPAFIDINKKVIYLFDDDDSQWSTSPLGSKKFFFKSQHLTGEQKFQLALTAQQYDKKNKRGRRRSSVQSNQSDTDNLKKKSSLSLYPDQFIPEETDSKQNSPQDNNQQGAKNKRTLFQQAQQGKLTLNPMNGVTYGFPMKSFDSFQEEMTPTDQKFIQCKNQVIEQQSKAYYNQPSSKKMKGSLWHLDIQSPTNQQQQASMNFQNSQVYGAMGSPMNLFSQSPNQGKTGGQQFFAQQPSQRSFLEFAQMGQTDQTRIQSALPISSQKLKFINTEITSPLFQQPLNHNNNNNQHVQQQQPKQQENSHKQLFMNRYFQQMMKEPPMPKQKYTTEKDSNNNHVQFSNSKKVMYTDSTADDSQQQQHCNIKEIHSSQQQYGNQNQNHLEHFPIDKLYDQNYMQGNGNGNTNNNHNSQGMTEDEIKEKDNFYNNNNDSSFQSSENNFQNIMQKCQNYN